MDSKIQTYICHDEGEYSSFDQVISAISGSPQLIVVFASFNRSLSTCLRQTRQRFPETLVIGATSGGEFDESNTVKNGIALFALEGDFKVYGGLGQHLGEMPEKAVRDAISSLPLQVPGYEHRSAIMLLDPLSGAGEQATLIAAALLGENVLLAGGAAADDLLMKETHVGFNEECSSDALALVGIYSKKPVSIGVRHGHTLLNEKLLTITESTGNTLKSIDGEPAWDVWKRATREHAKSHGFDVDSLTPKNATPFLLRYEAGLASGNELKIRAPLSLNENHELVFACAVPEGTQFSITQSTAQGQITSAKEAARIAHEKLEGECAGALVFDCVCRNMILDKDFHLATTGIRDELMGAPLAGFVTYGEIALEAEDFSGFHNTTTVIMAFPK